MGMRAWNMDFAQLFQYGMDFLEFTSIVGFSCVTVSDPSAGAGLF